MDAIIPINKLTNRSQKRKYKAQAMKVTPRLEEINDAFIWHLFNAEPTMSYGEIYRHFLREWNDAINKFAASKVFPAVGIDRLFFEENYKPELYIK